MQQRRKTLSIWAVLAHSANSMDHTLTSLTLPFHPWNIKETWKAPHCSTSQTKCRWSPSYLNLAWQQSPNSKTCRHASRNLWPPMLEIKACDCPLSVTVAIGRERSQRICLPRIIARLHWWLHKTWEELSTHQLPLSEQAQRWSSVSILSDYYQRFNSSNLC